MKKFLTPFVVALFTALPLFARADVVYLTNPLGVSDPRVLVGRLISGILSIVGSVTLFAHVICAL